MEFLKRNGMGLAAILCCCVLGVLLAQQSGQLQGLRQENDALTTRLDAAESAAEPEVPAAAPNPYPGPGGRSVSRRRFHSPSG